MATQGQGPLNDPRLVERRGDLSGLNALMFVILVVVGFLAAAFFLYTLIKGAPTASPSPSRTAVATQTSSPSRSPLASISPSSFPADTFGGSLPITVSLGTQANLVIDGQVAGQATVISARYTRSLQGKTAPSGKRWLLISVRLVATGTLTYDENFWSAVDASGASYGWRGSDPDPSLGQGTLNPGQTVTGNVTFQVPAKPAIASLTLGADDGSQLLVVRLP